MREYLFRGKRLDNGEWVSGGSIFKLINKSGDHFFIPQLGEKLIATHDDNMMNIVALENMTMYRVDPETVGQYTGLRDCKRTKEYPEGQMIFEGDVVVSTNANRLSNKPYIVEFSAISGYWCCDPKREPVVIGNIHDNPELLKEGGE